TACAAAAGGFRAGPALAALIGALALQVAANYINDVADYEQGTDTAGRLGPTRATAAGWLTPRQMWAGVAATIGVAALAGLYLTWVAGWPVLAVGAASMLAAFAYSAGPFPLTKLGMGEPFVMVFFGFVATCGTAWVQALVVPAAAWWGGFVCGALSIAILVVNNTRDHATDRAAGRRTLPARLGKRAGVIELAAFLVLAHAATIGAVLSRAVGAWVLGALVTAPLGVLLVRRVATCDDGPTLNRELARAGQLLLLHSLLWSVGVLA
ncbi:MAG: 1,4-dihydroxy-2-naphthoate octaprenyltransferase, partial [Holophagae bacterium]|nr:1,4-dihydroxy-2-naphthoate octaprenyltransferase [Holophagae bacterium]